MPEQEVEILEGFDESGKIRDIIAVRYELVIGREDGIECIFDAGLDIGV